MAYLQTHFWPGGTEEQYQSMLRAVHPADGLPEGQTSHVAGPTDGGYLISVVWDSKEHSERFMNGTLCRRCRSRADSRVRPRSAWPKSRTSRRLSASGKLPRGQPPESAGRLSPAAHNQATIRSGRSHIHIAQPCCGKGEGPWQHTLHSTRLTTSTIG